MLTRFKDWFTTDRRAGIQVFLGSLAPLFILVGFGTDSSWEQWLIISGATLQFVASLLSLLNLKAGDWGAGFTVLRGALYALAAVVSPALVMLGFYSAEVNATLLLGLSLALGALSNLVAILAGKQQQVERLQSDLAKPYLPGLSPLG